jgi:putative endonuclease
MPTDARKIIGRRGEQLAAEHFERLGWIIVARNHHTRFGELDIVALDGETLVFAEVKTCRLGKGTPWESLHERKRAQVRRMAGVWLSEFRPRPRFFDLRCDAVGVVLDARGDLVRLDHLRAAF